MNHWGCEEGEEGCEELKKGEEVKEGGLSHLCPLELIEEAIAPEERESGRGECL